MIFGVGIDIENPERFRKYGFTRADALPVITEAERLNYAKWNSHFCSAFSFGCKEAFFKALGGNRNKRFLHWKDVELFFPEHPLAGKARVVFSGRAEEIINRHQLIHPPYFRFYLHKGLTVFEAVLEYQ